MNKKQIRTTVLTAVFTALIAAGAYIAIPIGPVPIVLTTFFVLLSGLLGGALIGLYSVGMYLLLGVLGLPVFAGGAGGFAVLAGPTGGYLIGYLLASVTAGLLYRSSKKTPLALKGILVAAAALIGAVMVYIPGLPWLKYSLSMEWTRALQIGLIPFIPGDILKAAAAAALGFTMKERFRMFLEAE